MSAFEISLLVAFVIFLALIIIVFIRLGSLTEAISSGGDGDQWTALQSHLAQLKEGNAGFEKRTRDEFAQNRDDVNKRLDAMNKQQDERLNALADTIRKLGQDQGEQQQQFRDKLDAKMKELRTENSQKLDEMRKTVDEQLQTTLEKRLSESFKTVSERLEAVHQGLGDMQKLATGVGDLKRVLTNVKSRGGFGEKELEMLIEDFLSPEQFKVNYDCGKSSGGERVEFGIKVPGNGNEVYLPVDAKFPREDYERLLGAAELGDTEGMKSAGDALERTITRFAKDMASKYINPPSTTDWAILFLPTEGLYAEILRRPGLFEKLQREYKVTIAGPTNIQVLLSTFRMGFRQVALQERANEVWDVLGAVKREFNNYGEQITAMSKNLDAASKHVGKLETRKNAMLRALKNVEELPEGDKPKLLEE